MWQNTRMASISKKAKRLWRPRFSLKTLAIVVTLACVYFGTWEATKEWGCPQVLAAYWDGEYASSPMPFIVIRSRFTIRITPKGFTTGTDRTYCLWFFGCFARLHGPDHRHPD